MKFLYLTHNQNIRVCEHLLKELTDTTSLADMPYINVITRDPGQMGKAVEAIEVIADHSLESLEATVQIVALIFTQKMQGLW